jgi:osmotically-inducible protein OsmY
MSSRYYGEDYDRHDNRDEDSYRERAFDPFRSSPFNRLGRPVNRSNQRRQSEAELGRDYGSYSRERDPNPEYGDAYQSRYGRVYGSRHGSELGTAEDRYRGGSGREREEYRTRSSAYAPNYERSYGPSYGRNQDSRINYNSAYEREGSRGGDYRYDDERAERERHERGWWDRINDELASWFGDAEAERRREADLGRVSHRGKGPRGYRRSDERVKEDVAERLTDDDYLDASDIELSVIEGVVILTGTVSSRWAKRTAEDLSESVSGVKDVQNNLLVGRGETPSLTAQKNEEDPDITRTSKARARGA